MTEVRAVQPRVGPTHFERPAAPTSSPTIETSRPARAPIGPSASTGGPDEPFAIRRPAGARLEAMTVEDARVWLARGEPDRSLASLDLVWHDAIDSELPWVLRAAALALLGRASDAIALRAQTSARLPRSSALLYLGALAQLAEGNPSAAAELLGRALTIRPGDPLLLGLSAVAAAREGRHGEAQSTLGEAFARDGAHPALGTLRDAVFATFDGQMHRAGAFGEPHLLVQALVTPALSLVVDQPLRGASVGGRTVTGEETGQSRWVEPVTGWAWWGAAWSAAVAQRIPRSGGARLIPLLLAVAGAAVALGTVPNRTSVGWLLAIAVGILALTAVRVGMRRSAQSPPAEDVPMARVAVSGDEPLLPEP